MTISTNRLSTKFWHLSIVASLLAGCAPLRHASNLDSVGDGTAYQAQYRDQSVQKIEKRKELSAQMNLQKCSSPMGDADGEQLDAGGTSFDALSPGDMVELSVGEDERYSGRYEVSSDGMLRLRDVSPLKVLGKGLSAIEDSIAKALIDQQIYDQRPKVSLRLVEYGTARSFVSGAIFEPGMVTMGQSVESIGEERMKAMGAATFDRRLSRALQNAGGVRPDADLSHVTVRRGKKIKVIDLRGAITGAAFNDVVLLDGDQINVPSRKCFQQELMVPSVVTSPGVKVFMSNLIEPANNNAGAAIGKEARELRYGTRFLQALIGMNCVGGAKLTNADRTAVLYSRNPITGNSVVIERRIEDLMRFANRDDFDPFILPNDALACYDSQVTDVTKVAQSFGLVGAAVILGRGL